MDERYTFDRVVELNKQLTTERIEASRWRGTATMLADTIIRYLQETHPAHNIPEYLYRRHEYLYEALEHHSNRLYDNPDHWQKELGTGDI